jgi:hypothetical protein
MHRLRYFRQDIWLPNNIVQRAVCFYIVIIKSIICYG